jgi:HK97 gp10 family phage protein
MSIEFRGLEDVQESLSTLFDYDKVEQALKECCLLVERSAKQKAPKGNGQLRQSITSTVKDLEGIVYTPLEYAPYVEYGTGLFSVHPMGGRTDVPWCYKDEKTGEFIWTNGQNPKPYMRPALDENRDQIKQILKEVLFND